MGKARPLQYRFQAIKFVNSVVHSPCEAQQYNKLNYYTVNPRISARGPYFKFRRRRGTLIRGRHLIEGGRLFNFSQIVL